MICRESSSAVDDWEPPPSSRTQLVDQNRRKRDEALEELYRLGAAGKVDTAMDRMYRHFHELIMAKNYSECNAFLDDMDVERLPNAVLVGILTISYQVRNHVATRPEAFRRIEAKLGQTMSAARVAATLRGLEGRQ